MEQTGLAAHSTELKAMGFQESIADPSLFINDDSKGYNYVLVYVDDILIAAKNMVRVNVTKAVPKGKHIFCRDSIGVKQ